MKSKLPQLLLSWFSEYHQLVGASNNNNINTTNNANLSNITTEALAKFVEKTRSNPVLLATLETTLIDLLLARPITADHVESIRHICSTVFAFYKNTDVGIQLLAIDLLPNLLQGYVIVLSQPGKAAVDLNNLTTSPQHLSPKPHNHDSSTGIPEDLSALVTLLESSLLGMYNLCIQRCPALVRGRTFRVPLLAEPSMFSRAHVDAQLPSGAAPGESTNAWISSGASGGGTTDDPPLTRINSSSDSLPSSGLLENSVLQQGFQTISRVTSENRSRLLALLVRQYTEEVHRTTQRSQLALCRFGVTLTALSSSSVTTEAVSTSQPTTKKRSPSFRKPPFLFRKASDETAPSTTVVGQAEFHRVRGVTEEVLVELVSGLYFIMFNGQAQRAIDALHSTQTRAEYECFPQVQLTVNAILNSLVSNPSGAPADGPMGISVNLSSRLTGSMLLPYLEEPSTPTPLQPTTVDGLQATPTASTAGQAVQQTSTIDGPAVDTSVVSPARARFKAIITNASFRTKKMPDDIPIRAHLPPPKNREDGRGGRLQDLPEEPITMADVTVAIMASQPMGNKSVSSSASTLGNRLRNIRKAGSKETMQVSPGHDVTGASPDANSDS